MALVTGDGFGYPKGIRISYAASMEDIDEALGEVMPLFISASFVLIVHIVLVRPCSDCCQGSDQRSGGRCGVSVGGFDRQLPCGDLLVSSDFVSGVRSHPVFPSLHRTFSPPTLPPGYSLAVPDTRSSTSASLPSSNSSDAYQRGDELDYCVR